MDMEALKRDYCAGEISIEKVAKKHGIAKSTLVDMARKNGWVRQKKPTKPPTKASVQNKNSRTVRRKNGRTEKRSKTPSENGDSELSIDPDEYGLTRQQAWFAYWFVKTRCRVEAYRLAEFEGEGNTAYVGASRLYRKDKVQRAIRDLEKKVAKRYQVEFDELISQLVAIINADPNALSQYRRVNCRHCWGDGHKYQWRDLDEQLQAEKRAESDDKAPPDFSGGIGFVENMDPNPNCPRCNGEGEGETFYSDTRDLLGNERQYFLGVKESKFGIEILTEDKKSARAQLLQLLAHRRNEQLQSLDIERLQLANEKLRAEIENLRNGAKGNDTIVIHNTLKVPGAAHQPEIDAQEDSAEDEE
ncbi:terminase small subunit [Serratia sp. CY76391]|uniref:terminase small subunit n=1 Tax=Serratia sp. CY76391 TaxID=3383681 RepID=UPI003FA09A37